MRESKRDKYMGSYAAKAKAKHFCWDTSTAQKTHDSKNRKLKKKTKNQYL